MLSFYQKQNLNRLTNDKLAWSAFLSDITGREFELWVEITFHFLRLILLTRIPIDISNDTKPSLLIFLLDDDIRV